jgi:hypothetical protein
MLSRTDSRRPTERTAPAGADGQLGLVDMYLTNEVFLYRVVDVFAAGADETVELEDCYWLDVVRVPTSELRARRMRVVTPAR